MVWKFLKQNVLTPKGLNWVQHWVSRTGLFNLGFNFVFCKTIQKRIICLIGTYSREHIRSIIIKGWLPLVAWTIKAETTVCKREIGICLPSPSRCQSVTGVNWPRGTEKTSYRDQARHLQHRGKTSTHAPGWAFLVSFSVTLSSQIKVSRALSASFCVFCVQLVVQLFCFMLLVFLTIL